MFSGFMTVPLVFALAAPAPAPAKNSLLGMYVCLKQNNVTIYEKTKEGQFEPIRFFVRYLDMKVVAVEKDYVCLAHDNAEIWVERENILTPKEAIKYYTEIIEKEPTNERAISCRCWAYMAAGELNNALHDANEAVRLNPDSTAWKNNRGECYNKRKEYDKAIDEFTEILKTAPKYYFALLNRSESYIRTKKFDLALKDLEEVIKLEANVPQIHANLARVLATAPDEKIRDGKRALEAATIACKATKYRDGKCLEALAAAYAELGQFDEAIKYQSKALDDTFYVKEEGDGPRQRLALYRDKKPFHDK